MRQLDNGEGRSTGMHGDPLLAVKDLHDTMEVPLQGHHDNQIPQPSIIIITNVTKQTLGYIYSVDNIGLFYVSYLDWEYDIATVIIVGAWI